MGPILCQFAKADGPCCENCHLFSLLGKKPVGCLLSPQLHIKPATVYVQSQIHSVHQLQSSKCRCPQLIIPAHSRVTSSSEGCSFWAVSQPVIFFFFFKSAPFWSLKTCLKVCFLFKVVSSNERITIIGTNLPFQFGNERD